jgi:erythromycin esterase-like protein
VLVGPKPAAASICLSLSLLIHAACNRSAIRIEPISGILDAFRSHQIVALGEGLHGNSQAHAFRLALIREPRFASVVNDLVVEFGSGR